MTSQEEITIIEVPSKQRYGLEWILQESFEGWYLMHSKRTLQHIELVRAAMSSGQPVGLVMLKILEGTIGYVYYIDVEKAQKKKGIGQVLLEDSLKIFRGRVAEKEDGRVVHDNAASE